MQHGAFDDVNLMVKDAIFSDIADQLLEDWINNLLDEGQYFADLQVASMSGDPLLQDKFNKFYDLKEEDNDYFRLSN
jgi:hypothetical protein